MSFMERAPRRLLRFASWVLLLCVCAWAPAPRAQSGESGEWRGHLLETNGWFVCFVDGNGKIKCPGNDPQIAGAWPDKVFQSVANGEWGVCGLGVDGQAVCRSGSYQAGTMPSGQWRMLSIGAWGGCGIRPEGNIDCWGGWTGLASGIPADGPFLSVAVGDHDACALRADGTLACWNERLSMDPDFGPPPPDHYLKVDIGPTLACAVRSDGVIACWGPFRDRGDAVPPGGDYVDVSVGSSHACGLRVDGEVVCRGSTRLYGTPYAMTSPQGRFAEITSTYDRACGRRVDGIVTCWGEEVSDAMLIGYGGASLTRMSTGGGEVCVLDADDHPHCFGERSALVPPPGRYLQLSLASDSACGIDLHQRVRCWGAPLGPTPMIPLSSIAVSTMHACGVGLDERLVCWGTDSIGLGDVPQGNYRSVVTGNDYGCALSTAGSVTCWGTNPPASSAPVGAGFSGLYAGNRTACASRESGVLECWGDVPDWYRTEWIFGQESVVIGDHFLCWLSQGDIFCHADPATGLPIVHGGNMSAFAGTGDTLCTIDDAARVVCEGSLSLEAWIHTLRAGRGQLAAGAAHTCSSDAAGSIDCWGDGSRSQTTPTMDEAGRIDANGDHTCATDGTGLLHCWGDPARGANLTPPGLQVRDLAVGQFGGCGIDKHAAAVCWGWNANGQANPPPQLFRHVATGLNHSCGVVDDGTLACWGYAADGQTVAPAGTYLTVDVGERHSCAIAADGRLRCWGLDSEGQSSPPQGDATYVALSVGAFHACAIRSDGALACWGRNDRGQSSPPDGRFVSVAAGGAHTCAIRDSGGRVCWGDGDSGQAPSLSLGPDALAPAAARYGGQYEVQFTLNAGEGYVPPSPVFRIVHGDLVGSQVLAEDGRLLLYTTDTSRLYRFTVEARDANGFAATRDYVLQVGPSTDDTPPVIGVSISGPLGDNGWYVGDVHVAWTVDDPESGIVDITGCLDQTQTSDAAYSVPCRATNRAGLSRDEWQPIKRDTTPPIINAWYWPQSAPNANGWFNEPEHVRYRCSDQTSGTTDPCPPDADFLTDGVHVPPSHTVRDKAGNVASTPQTLIRIDTTPPVLDAVMPPGELPVGATHDYHASATDALSGVASVSCTPVDTSPYDGGPGGPERQARCTAIDLAGNAAVISSTYIVVAPAPDAGADARARRVQAGSPRGKGVRLLRRGSGTQHKRAR